MKSSQGMTLSFFPISTQDFEFEVSRKRYKERESREHFPGCQLYRLPLERESPGSRKYEPFWITFESHAGWESFHCRPHDNPYLTCEYLFGRLKKTCVRQLSQGEYRLPVDGEFRQRKIDFVIAKHQLGQQMVWLDPFFLKSENEFGFLADFRFRPYPNIKHSVETLKLSLALNREGKRNTDFYSSRFFKLQDFVNRFRDKIFSIDEDISILNEMKDIGTQALEVKTYQFSSGRHSKSQFHGVKDHGPFERLNEEVKLHFLFRDDEVQFSRGLYRALRGDTYPRVFPGMRKMFGYQFDSSTVAGSVLPDFTLDAVENTISDVIRGSEPSRVVPLFVSPFDGFSDDTSLYYKIKHLCLRHKIPSQFVSIPLLRQRNQFKWALSNIGLQLFAKMGGIPWKVVPKTERCLIVGIGQAHSYTRGEIQKYYAYSVLTDASGMYRELRVLGNTDDEKNYLSAFARTLSDVFGTYYEQYDTFVVHTAFNIGRDEISAIRAAIDTTLSESNSDRNFVVMKFNDRNKFFAYATENNSMTPYESTYVQLSKNDYLVWYEGLQYHKPTIVDRIERPMHIKFIYSNRKLLNEDKTVLLQDALNLSGVNWRGFNAKSLPVSMYYATLVARFFKEFRKLNLDEPDIESLRPWFL